MSQIEIRVRFNLMMKDLDIICFLMDVDCGAEDVMAKTTPLAEKRHEEGKAQKRHGEKMPQMQTDVQRRQGRVWRKKTPRRENATAEDRCPVKDKAV